MELYEQYGPKMSWQGPGYKWYCEECKTAGTWQSRQEAKASGEQHAQAKHKAAADWKPVVVED